MALREIHKSDSEGLKEGREHLEILENLNLGLAFVLFLSLLLEVGLSVDNLAFDGSPSFLNLVG